MPKKHTRAKHRTLSVLCLVLLSAMTAGCMGFGTPPSSMLKLARMQPLEADPAAIRFAVATPGYLRLRDGDIIVTVKFDTGDRKTSFVEQYKPVIDGNAPPTPGIDRRRLKDRNLVVARFHEDDRAGFLAMQARIKAYRAAGGDGQGSLSIGATGCRVAPASDGPAQISAWLQAEPGGDYFALFRGMDLRKQLKAAGTDVSAIPDCGASAAGQAANMGDERSG